MDNEDGDPLSYRERYGVLKTPRKRRKVFINGELHHIIHINRPADICTTFNYIQDKILRYPYKSMKKHFQKAYLINEVSRMVNRHPERIRIAINEGHLKNPQRSGPNGKFYFNEDDILDIQNYFANVHYGRPRKDGAITPLKRRTVTKEEVDAKLGRRDVLYVQNDKGEFIPVWRTIDF
jgi:hypothetical protein